MSNPITVSDEAVEAALTVWSAAAWDTIRRTLAKEGGSLPDPAAAMRAALEAAAPFIREAPAPLSQAQPAPSVGEAVQIERDVIEAHLRQTAGHYTPGSDGFNTFLMEADWVRSRALSTSTPEEKP